MYARSAGREKKTLSASERDETWRHLFAHALLDVNPDDLLYLDESGFHTSMTRSHARSPRGERAYGSVPRNRGRNLTLVCALSLSGPSAEFVVEGGVNGDVFVTYVREVLGPTLRPGMVVVMDHLGAHHRSEVRDLIEQRDAVMVLLPPYSPDLNPIELLFSKLKAAMRALGERTRAGVLAALRSALDTVTAPDVQGWFHHARYPQWL